MTRDERQQKVFECITDGQADIFPEYYIQVDPETGKMFSDPSRSARDERFGECVEFSVVYQGAEADKNYEWPEYDEWKFETLDNPDFKRVVDDICDQWEQWIAENNM